MRNTKIKAEHLFDFSDDPTDVVIIDTLPRPDFEDDEVTQPMAKISMAELVGVASIGPDRPTRDLKPMARPAWMGESDGVPIPVERERTQPYRHAYAGRVVLSL